MPKRICWLPLCQQFRNRFGVKAYLLVYTCAKTVRSRRFVLQLDERSVEHLFRLRILCQNNNINWRDVQIKNVVNNVDMSSLRAHSYKKGHLLSKRGKTLANVCVQTPHSGYVTLGYFNHCHHTKSRDDSQTMWQKQSEHIGQWGGIGRVVLIVKC